LKISPFIVLAVILPSLFLDTARAQDASKPEAPTEIKSAPAAPPKFVLEFDSSDINVLNQCVGDMAFKVAQPFVAKINAQIAPQVAKQAKPQ
jgi:hypothetical protein